MLAPTIQWTGLSGKEYKYWIHPIDHSVGADQPGNYIFAKETGPHEFIPFYIGETEELDDRIGPGHHKWSCITRHGVTHVHVHAKESEDARLAERNDLISLYQPVCNG